MIYAQFLGQGGISHDTPTTGLPTIVQAEWGTDYFGYKCTVAASIHAAICVDYEPSFARLAPGFGSSRKAAVNTQLAAHADEARKACRTARSISPNSPIVLYANAPYTSAKDNDRLAASGLYLDADAMACNVYLDASNAKEMTPEIAAAFTREKIAAARRYRMRIVVYVSPRYVNGSDVPADILAAQLAACDGYDVCLWADGVDEATAGRYGAGKQ